MPNRPKPRISPLKTPRQARSTQLVSDILEAAIHVLMEGGAHSFTTARVAERAGVSVGSLYQYFPNKEAILFRLQTDEWRQTSSLLHGMLGDRSVPPYERLKSVLQAFFRSECEEAAFRMALGDAAPLYRDAPEAREYREEGVRLVQEFMNEAVPYAPPQDQATAGNMLMMTMEAIGEQLSEQGLPIEEVDRTALAMTDMFCAYLDSLNRKYPPTV